MMNSNETAKILIVEDSPTQAEWLKFLLEEEGYQVIIAVNGKHALISLEGYQPELIISDIVMPQMNGYELCKQIKSDQRTQGITVILMTTLSDIEDVLKAVDCGADSFITKSYSKDYLMLQIRRFLAARSLHQSEGANKAIEIHLTYEHNIITIDPQRLFGLMLSTYEAAMYQNSELTNKTKALESEIAQRERLQEVLHALSVNDELTGLYNRRGFMLLAERQWLQALRRKEEFVILYADVDNLKYINDTYGHAKGDEYLQEISSVIKRTSRESDVVARIGGDEFTMLLSNCGKEFAQVYLNRLKENLRKTVLIGTHDFFLSLSVGMAHFDPNEQESIDDLLKRADMEMYACKQERKKAERGAKYEE